MGAFNTVDAFTILGVAHAAAAGIPEDEALDLAAFGGAVAQDALGVVDPRACSLGEAYLRGIYREYAKKGDQ